MPYGSIQIIANCVGCGLHDDSPKYVECATALFALTQPENFLEPVTSAHIVRVVEDCVSKRRFFE